ncbi:hypothetical protein PPERSA_08804 [Pseudocohnilembus persalinus]|uniref:Outer arm dynein light chain 1 n=1 Tax=Pseudocohnilembus persalinus TaxID=266149 RepID=A0A0V0R408_PSEPJ|nr:hypothetical protein PPERSA_08804 [Pseudocohnilembus persalinus]|eukprot:KRX09088.1 hypothetical protein PPERSA_08804 [Pseudocohnilembus persalinus]
MLQKKSFDRDEKGQILMTKKNVLLICEQEEGCYEYAELNSKLYLNHKSFDKIQNLDAFINVQALYLENNLISKIEGLEKMQNLTTLYLQSNMIKKIEGLENNKELIILNLSKNSILKVENLGHLQKLRNLDLSFNYLKDSDSIQELTELKSVTTIDIQNNNIEYDDKLIDILTNIKELLVLYFGTNPCVREIKNYRKQMIYKIPKLTYLDDKPVSHEKRIFAQKFIEGGIESVIEERKKQREVKEQKKQEEIEAFKKTQFRKKSQKLHYLKSSLKGSLLKEADYSQKLNKAISQGQTQQVEFLRKLLFEESQNQNSLEDAIGSIQSQLEKLTENGQFLNQNTFEGQIHEQTKQDLLKDEDIDMILNGLVQKHSGNNEEILNNFNQTLQLINKHLNQKINIEQIQEKIKEKIEQYKENTLLSEDLSSKIDSSFSSLQPYNTSNSSQQISSQNSETYSNISEDQRLDDQNSETEDLDELD